MFVYMGKLFLSVVRKAPVAILSAVLCTHALQYGRVGTVVTGASSNRACSFQMSSTYVTILRHQPADAQT